MRLIITALPCTLDSGGVGRETTAVGAKTPHFLQALVL